MERVPMQGSLGNMTGQRKGLDIETEVRFRLSSLASRERDSWGKNVFFVFQASTLLI